VSSEPGATPPTIAAEYFDGRSARAHPVTLSWLGSDLQIEGTDLRLAIPQREVQWPERTRHGTRTAHLPDGASLHCADPRLWDDFVRAGGRGDSAVVRAQQSWRWVLASIVTMAVVLGAMYAWGVPWAARAALPLIPATVDVAIGEQAMASLDEHLLKPSKLPADQRQRLRAAFERALAAQQPGTVPPHRFEFRSSSIGPNAFALPGGTMVVLDELVEMVGGDESVLTGVVAHEIGHVRHRHGMRMLVQASAISVIASAVVGDFSSLLATVPIWLGQAAYSRDAEREADADAARILKQAGISPAVMVSFFEKVATWQPPRPAGSASAPGADAASAPGPADRGKTAPDRGTPRRREASGLGIAIASHPADAERIRFFEEAARH
jgi:Zn-dependent protease with chaperone function